MLDEPIKRNLKMFFYWINERHKMHIKKEKGDRWPWTKDPILQKYKFTNVFRNLDAVTKELHTRVDFGYYSRRKRSEIEYTDLLFRICLFRMFNHPDTYSDFVDSGLHKYWNIPQARKVLNERKKKGKQIFTGAYIITNSGSTEPKTELMISAISKLFLSRRSIFEEVHHCRSLQAAHKVMTKYPMIGDFIAYELVTDFRWTPILNQASDIMEWANPGPGARRGLSRIWYDDIKYKGSTQDCIERMKLLLQLSSRPRVLWSHMSSLEMRDIEHSLCEFDKYMRVKNGEGRPRSKYKPPQGELT